MSQELNQKFVFPENSAEIIAELMEKYRIKETIEEEFTKLKKNEIPYGKLIAILVREYCEKSIDIKELIFEIQKELNISEINATNLAQDIHEKFVSVKNEQPDFALNSFSKEIKEKSKTQTEDSYREPLE